MSKSASEPWHLQPIAPVTPTLGMIAIALEVALRHVGCTHNVEQRGGVAHGNRSSRMGHGRLNCPQPLKSGSAKGHSADYQPSSMAYLRKAAAPWPIVRGLLWVGTRG